MIEAHPDSKRGRRTLLILFALFLAPVLAAVFLNSRWTDWQPAPSRNHGQLVQPVLPLGPVWGQATGDVPELTPWRLLISQTGNCDASCLASLDSLARVRRTLGRDEDRLQLVLVTTEPRQELPPGIGLWTDPAGRLADHLEQRQLAFDGVFLVDPLGNLMMHFPSPVDASGLGKDIDRLVSHSKFQ